MSSKKTGISVRDKMDTFSLMFNTEELLESIESNIVNNPNSSVFSNCKRAWFGQEKPETLRQIDIQLRKKYNIPEENKMICCVYYPPEKGSNNKYTEKKVILKNNKTSIFNRFIVSTIQELCTATYGSSQPDVFEMRSWISYKTPDMIGGMLDYVFSNDKNLTIPAKKGHRQVRKVKNLDKRYILVFDYLVSKNQYEELNNLLTNSQKPDDKNVSSALEALKNI